MACLNHPITIDWEVTPGCNHCCLHCYNSWRTLEESIIDEKIHSSFTEESLLTIAKKIVDAKPVSVIITGGEPLSVFGRLESSIRLLIENGIDVSINTNVALLTEEIAKRLSAMDVRLFISFPCSEPEVCDYITGRKGSFARICNGIRLADENNIDYALNMVVSKLNLKYIFSSAEYVKKNFKTNYFAATKVSVPCNANSELMGLTVDGEEFDYMLKELLRVRDVLGLTVDSAWAYSLCGFSQKDQIEQFAFKRNCGAGRYSIAVDYKGEIRACAVDVVPYGNILVDDVSVALSRMAKWQDDEMLPTKCKECKHHENGLCNGGCRLDASNTYGDMRALDSTANESNANSIDYENFVAPFDILDENEVYKMNDVHIVEDTIGWRVSYGDEFIFATKEFIDYLMESESFTIRDIMNRFGLEYDEVNIVFNDMVTNCIISRV